MKQEREWYTECTDRCGICFKLPLKTKTSEGHSFFCRGKCFNQSEPDPNIALAVCKWNIKQRQIRGKI